METVLTNILANAISKPRREMLDGRPYLVIDSTGLIEDVLPGSDGPIFYPASENTRNADAWNHMPLVLYHPQRNGRNVSARHPSVISTQGLGNVWEAEGKDGKLTFQAWFDELKVKEIDKRFKLNLYDKLIKGEPIGLSTGLIIDQEAAQEGANYNGKPYKGIARNQRPDHVAVLPDVRGACSIEMGCGFNVRNSSSESSILNRLKNTFLKWVGLDSGKSLSQQGTTTNETTLQGVLDMALTSQQRTESIAIVGNCECWKNDPKAQEVLNALSDDQIAFLRQGIESDKGLQLTTNTLREIAKTTGMPNDIKLNEMPAHVKGRMKDECDPGDETGKDGKKKVANNQQQTVTNDKGERLLTEAEWIANSKPLSDSEWYAKAPESVRERDRYATEVFNREKKAVVTKLIAHIQDPERRNIVGNQLMKETMEKLESMLELVPQQVDNSLFGNQPINFNAPTSDAPIDQFPALANLTQSRVANFSGNGGMFGQVPQSRGRADFDVDPNDVLPTVNESWADIVASQRGQNKQTVR